MKPPSILLVDDDSTTNYLNKQLSKCLDVANKLIVVENGQEALDLLAGECVPPLPRCPVFILLDLNVPGTNGFVF